MARKDAMYCPVCEKKVFVENEGIDNCPICGCDAEELECWEDDLHNPSISAYDLFDNNY